jgi:hypothetical protein
VQILAVVANIQMRTLKTEVGNGSMPTVIGHGLAGPKGTRNCTNWPVEASASVSRLFRLERESGQNSTAQAGALVATQRIFRTPVGTLGKVLFFSLRTEDPGMDSIRDRV